MSASYSHIIESPMFKFIIGSQKKPMMIHSALIAKQSSVLSKLVNGPMEEARTGTVTWEDVDEDTFALFAEFLYTGDYTPLSHSISEDPQSPSTWKKPKQKQNFVFEFGQDSNNETEQQAIYSCVYNYPEDREPVLDSFSGARRSRPRRRQSRTQITIGHNDIKDYTYPLPVSFRSNQTWEPRPNQSPNENYTPAFLGHARLYAFAEKYDIETLKAITLHKLYRTLYCFTPYEARYGDILELARYTFENTPSRERIDGLREMVTRYIAQNAEKLAGSEQCLSLVEECGPFARDLFSMVLSRVKETTRVPEGLIRRDFTLN